MSQLILSLPSIAEIAAVVSVVSGAYIKIRKILKYRLELKELEKSTILSEAKEQSQKYKKELESKIDLLESDLHSKLAALSQEIKNVESSAKKDLSHAVDSYNSEIRFLGAKIEELKDEVRTQVAQIVSLIGKLIDKT